MYKAKMLRKKQGIRTTKEPYKLTSLIINCKTLIMARVEFSACELFIFCYCNDIMILFPFEKCLA